MKKNEYSTKIDRIDRQKLHFFNKNFKVGAFLSLNTWL